MLERELPSTTKGIVRQDAVIRYLPARMGEQRKWYREGEVVPVPQSNTPQPSESPAQPPSNNEPTAAS